jgi:hypothetical protein
MKYSTVYTPISKTGLTSVTNWMSIIMPPLDIQLVTRFQEGLVPREKTTVIAAMGVEFASAIQYDTPLVVKDCGTMAILGCF